MERGGGRVGGCGLKLSTQHTRLKKSQLATGLYIREEYVFGHSVYD